MRISSLFHQGRPLFSFEFFPPKDEAATAALLETVQQLKSLKPDYISVTYGAGGSTRGKTLDLVTKIKRDLSVETVAHLTCVGHSRAEIRNVLNELADRGIENILALRGDPPKGQDRFEPHPDGFRYANELAEEIERNGRFCFGVAGYPEKHVEAKTLELDLQNLKRKVAAGASFIVTQLFFVNAAYFDFVARARAIGIHCPILPGIMPVTNLAQIQRFATLCGATLPQTFQTQLLAAGTDGEAVTHLGIDYASAQCRELLKKGAPGIHFYTLNKSRATQEVLEHLRPLRQTPQPLLRDI